MINGEDDRIIPGRSHPRMRSALRSPKERATRIGSLQTCGRYGAARYLVMHPQGSRRCNCMCGKLVVRVTDRSRSGQTEALAGSIEIDPYPQRPRLQRVRQPHPSIRIDDRHMCRETTTGEQWPKP